MAVSLVYTPPFPAVERARGNSNCRIVCHRLVGLVIGQYIYIIHISMRISAVALTTT